jgi:hypothetical protein
VGNRTFRVETPLTPAGLSFSTLLPHPSPSGESSPGSSLLNSSLQQCAYPPEDSVTLLSKFKFPWALRWSCVCRQSPKPAPYSHPLWQAQSATQGHDGRTWPEATSSQSSAGLHSSVGNGGRASLPRRPLV